MSPHNLADFEIDHDLPRGDYETQLEALQHRLELIQAAYIMQGLKGIVAIEGWDASGKGGLVTRMNATLDPRFCKVWSIVAPTREEAARHYLWRFWQRLPGNREIAGYTQEQVDANFSGMINAFKFGAPPHGGSAPGVDRMVMLIADEPNIREVIVFPMTQKAEDLMMNAPAPATLKQLRELHIRIVD